MTPATRHKCSFGGFALPGRMDKAFPRDWMSFVVNDHQPTLPTAIIPDRTAVPPSAADLLEEQRRAWQAGMRHRVEFFLKRHPALAAARDVVLDLIQSEIALREAQGERPALAEYRERLPQFADDLAKRLEKAGALSPQQGEAVATMRGEPEHVPAAPAGAVRTMRGVADAIPANAGKGATAFPPLPGYELLEVLGRGGMGVVYKARHLDLNRIVAVKMVLAGGHAGPNDLARFRNEAEAVARLQHPNIVQVYDVGDYRGQPYMALEFVDGNLYRKLAFTPQPARQAAQWVESLARAVHHAHQRGIVHRDLKLANILLSNDGSLKISDFGIAKMVQEHGPGQTQTGAVLGTPNYMAPEQAEGKIHQIGPATDVYGLGGILYEMLTGKPPFRGRTTSEILDQVRTQDPTPLARLDPPIEAPHDLETICLRCLQKDPGQRYPTAAALADELALFLAGEPIRSRPVTRTERLARWAQRRPMEAVLLGAGAMALIGLGIGIVWSHVLAVAAMGGLSLLLGSWWYSARLRGALTEANQQRQIAEQSVERLDLLLEMTRDFMRTRELDDMLRLLADTTARLTSAEFATIYLVDRERREIWSKTTVDKTVGEIRLPIGVGIAGTVAATAEPINIPDAYADTRFNRDIDRRTGLKTRNLLTVPMLARDHSVLGVFQVMNKRDAAFDKEDIAILSSLAESAAIAIEAGKK
jgi:putative methionine-R-sulfoxide reductase with GAF domain